MRLRFCLALTMLLTGYFHGVSMAFGERFMSGTVNVGALLSLTGVVAAQNQAFQEGIELAVEQLNSRGGLDGLRLKVIYEDSQLEPRVSNLAARKLIELDRVRAFISASAIETKAAAGVLRQAGIPVVTLWDASPELEKLGDNFLSIGLWTPSTGQAAAALGGIELGAKRAVVFSTNDEWSLEASAHFKSFFEKLGGKVVAEETFNPEEMQFRGAITRALASHPDYIYAPVTGNFPIFLGQLKVHQPNAAIATSDIIDDQMVRSNPRLFEGVYQTQAILSNSPELEKMCDSYRAKYSKSCSHPMHIAWGYDAIQVLKMALSTNRQPAMSSLGVRARLWSVAPLMGAAGEIRFNSKGTAPRRAEVVRVKEASIVAQSLAEGTRARMHDIAVEKDGSYTGK